MYFYNLKSPCILPQKFNTITRVEILSALPRRPVLADRRHTAAETVWCLVSRFIVRRLQAEPLHSAQFLLALAWLMTLSRHERLAGIVRMGFLSKIYYTYNKLSTHKHPGFLLKWIDARLSDLALIFGKQIGSYISY
jgi:hypothetical protein